MTQNAWGSDYPNANGEILIGSGSGRPLGATITAGTDVSITNGANSITINSTATGGAFTKISTATASASSSISFTDLSSTYFLYILRYSNLSPATDATTLIMRTSSNNGSSYDSTGGDYHYRVFISNETGAQSATVGSANANIQVLGAPSGGSDEMGSGTNEKGSGTIYIFNPSAAKWTFIIYEGYYLNESSQNIMEEGVAIRTSTSAVNAFELVMDSGNIASGDFVLYGVSNT